MSWFFIDLEDRKTIFAIQSGTGNNRMMIWCFMFLCSAEDIAPIRGVWITITRSWVSTKLLPKDSPIHPISGLSAGGYTVLFPWK